MKKLLLVENNRVEPSQYKKQNFLTESDQTVTVSEKVGEKVEYKAKAIYTFPISRPNKENLNGRVYNKKLWENQIKKLKEVSTYGLMDHPKTEGSTKDFWCVWRNLRFNETSDLIVADAYLVGSYGQDVLEALEAGGPVGLSTSGFGEFLEDKKTIDPESFELERVADFVFNPSYEVFGSQTNLVSKAEEVKVIEEIVKTDEENKMEDKKVKDEEKVKEIVEDSMTRSFKSNLALSFKQAKKKTSVQERIESYTDLIECIEEGLADELKEQISKELVLEKEALENKAITENTDLIEGLKSEVVELKATKVDLEEKYKNSTELLDSLKVYSTKLKEMYELQEAEKNGMITATEYRESQIYITKVEKEIEEAKTELNGLKKELIENKKEARIRTRIKVQEAEAEVEVDEEEVIEEEVEEKNYDNVPKAIMAYYNDLEFAEPSVIKIKEDILKCRTMMEAQKQYMRLKPLLGARTSSYDRYNKKSVMESNTFVESKQRLPRKDGWV